MRISIMVTERCADGWRWSVLATSGPLAHGRADNARNAVASARFAAGAIDALGRIGRRPPLTRS
jgi:hypothetical protein